MELGVDGKVGEPVPKSVDLGNKHGQEVAIILLLLMGGPSALERTLRLKVLCIYVITLLYDIFYQTVCAGLMKQNSRNDTNFMEHINPGRTLGDIAKK